MKLSVIIVNYNVRFFLEQCLHSVQEASKGIDIEVFVVDNNSVDGSCSMVKEKFPDTTLIENKKNTGFSYANNQALKLAKGEYVLLLNPDTVVDEDTFKKVITFMDDHPEAGSLGVKMIDGAGRFLPESKRALPTPGVAFYKIFGLSSLFPGSRKFGRYHLGYLDKDKISEVDILSGAFMLIRRSVLEKAGLLDEEFFMYGEDIDLSYRIIQAGYKNYYFPETTIIHYKGESTKKGSINYVRMFYNAMIIFAKKHFSRKNARYFSFLINLAIYFRAGISIFKRFLINFLIPFLDAVLIWLGFYLIKPYWEHYKFPEGGSYPKEYLCYVVPGYILIWLLTLLFSGGYSRPVKLFKVIRGIVIGSGIILIVYALLSEEYRFSRALILIGSAWALLSLIMLRFLMHYSKIDHFRIAFGKKKKVVIVGKKDEASRVHSLLKQTKFKPKLAGFVNPEVNSKNGDYIGNVEQLKEIVNIYNIEEIIFCSKDISAHRIIKSMLRLSGMPVDYKIAPPESLSVIGSNSINTAGDLYSVNINLIDNDVNKRNKRIFDIGIALLLLILYPFLVFIIKRPFKFPENCFAVLLGFRSWVGYNLLPGINIDNLPKIRKGILNPLDIHNRENESKDLIERSNMIYAKDYSVFNDLAIIFRSIRLLGE